MNVGPLQCEGLSVPEAGIQHQDRDVSERLRHCLQIFGLDFARKYELARSLPLQQPNARDAINHLPLVRKAQSAAQRCELPINGCRRDLLPAFLDVFLDQGFVGDCVERNCTSRHLGVFQ